MKPITSVSAVAVSVAQAVGGVSTALNSFFEALPLIKVLGVSVCPEMQPPSLRAPNGQMVYIATAVLQMDSEKDLEELTVLGAKLQPGSGMSLVK